MSHSQVFRLGRKGLANVLVELALERPELAAELRPWLAALGKQLED